MLAAVLPACDPGEHVFAVTIVNDTANEVTLLQCDKAPDCQNFFEHPKVKPGASHPTNVTDLGHVQWFRVVDASDGTLGCLPLKFDRKESGVRRLVSSAGDCP